MVARAFSLLGLFAAGLVISVGTFWAFDRGAPDFSVFYEAWRLVWVGRGSEVYGATPDYFLYAPGFAWLLAPMAFFPRNFALALWCLSKAAIIGFLIREFGLRRRPDSDPVFAAGISAWAVVLLARPLLIDFQYGQVNSLILGACAWALTSHFRRGSSPVVEILSWLVLTIAALAKIFPLPLLVIPFLPSEAIPRPRLIRERTAVIAGIALVLLIPVLGQGLQGTWQLHLSWRHALMLKGLPLETHNQSFSAFLYRYLGGVPAHVVALGPQSLVRFGKDWISRETVSLLSVAWTLITGGLIITWILQSRIRPPLIWAAILIGLLIVPSHLVWKPYFIMGLPAAILAVSGGLRWYFLLLIFGLVNLTGFDFVGYDWGTRFEGASVLLWTHLALLLGVLFNRSAQQRSRLSGSAK